MKNTRAIEFNIYMYIEEIEEKIISKSRVKVDSFLNKTKLSFISKYNVTAKIDECMRNFEKLQKKNVYYESFICVEIIDRDFTVTN